MSWIREKHLSMVLMQLSSLTRGGAEGTKRYKDCNKTM